MKHLTRPRSFLTVLLFSLLISGFQAAGGEKLGENEDLELQISQEGDYLQISWMGRGSLEWAEKIFGPWKKLSQTSPVIIPVDSWIGTRFYRLRPLLFTDVVMTFDVGVGPVRLKVGDLDRDELEDLVVVNIGSDDVSVLLDTGSGFSKQQPYGVGNSPSSLALADVNGDGSLDILTANERDHAN